MLFWYTSFVWMLPFLVFLMNNILAVSYMSVSKNSGTPKSSILIGFSIIFTIHFGGLPPLFLVQHPYISDDFFRPQLFRFPGCLACTYFWVHISIASPDGSFSFSSRTSSDPDLNEFGIWFPDAPNVGNIYLHERSKIATFNGKSR